jgi:hypothetical protein
VKLVSRFSKTLQKILRGASDANIRFEELRHLLAVLGFTERIRGDHHIYSREGIVEIINIQERNGKAKPYQVRQVRELLVRYQLAERELESEEDDHEQ